MDRNFKFFYVLKKRVQISFSPKRNKIWNLFQYNKLTICHNRDHISDIILTIPYQH